MQSRSLNARLDLGVRVHRLVEILLADAVSLQVGVGEDDEEEVVRVRVNYGGDSLFDGLEGVLWARESQQEPRAREIKGAHVASPDKLRDQSRLLDDPA
jgi:hypothetical protein